MRKLLRQPLTWMVIADCVVVAFLLVLVWNLVAPAPAPARQSRNAEPSSTAVRTGEKSGRSSARSRRR